MTHFRCPQCGAETQLEAEHGAEIVSVYCLKHAGGPDAHLQPVYMTPLTELFTKSVTSERTAVAA
jgi:hypothetical protein